MNKIKDELIPRHPLIGEILVRRNLISRKQLDEALEVQKKEPGFVGEILVNLGYLEERDVVVALIVQCGLPYIAVNKYDIPQEILKLIPAVAARELRVVPLDRVGDILSVVMIGPLSDSMQKELERMTQCKIAIFITTKSEINEAIARWYT